MQKRRGLFFEKPRSNKGAVIDARQLKKPQRAQYGAAALVRRAEHNPPAARFRNGARAHRAGFERDVKRRFGEAMVAELSGAFAKRKHLGMRARIPIAKRAVVRDCEHGIALREHRSDRHLISGGRFARCVERHSHEAQVGFLVDFGRSTVDFAVFCLKGRAAKRAPAREHLAGSLELVDQAARRDARARQKPRANGGIIGIGRHSGIEREQTNLKKLRLERLNALRKPVAGTRKKSGQCAAKRGARYRRIRGNSQKRSAGGDPHVARSGIETRKRREADAAAYRELDKAFYIGKRIIGFNHCVHFSRCPSATEGATAAIEFVRFFAAQAASIGADASVRAGCPALFSIDGFFREAPMSHALLRPARAGLFAAIILLAGTCAPYASAATAESDALADCLFENTTSADRDAMVQWAYVTIGKTSAAKAVQAIPSEKTKAVEANAQKVLTNLVMKRCAKPAMKLLLKDPKNGLQDTLGSLAVKLVKDETAKRASPILSLTITDLLRP